jgi:hypothetical protein
VTATIPEQAGDDRLAALQILRQPFPAENIAKRPQVNCGQCTMAARAKRGDTCDRHKMAKCNVCGQWITTGHMHLDYVGHAEATDRLLDADIEWGWEPMALTPAGLPLFDELGGMWIRLTVAGVTRLGYGSAPGKTGPDAIKEIIGDAIRNSGMRFGLALDLWARTDLHADERDEPEVEQERPMTRPPSAGPAVDEWTKDAPPLALPGQVDNILSGLRLVRGITDETAMREAIEAMVGHPVPYLPGLLFGEAVRIIATLTAEHEAKQNPPPVSTPNNPGISDGQKKLIQAHFSAWSRENRLAEIARILDNGPVLSVNDLSKAEASRVIEAIGKSAPVPVGASA